jgi:glutaminase
LIAIIPDRAFISLNDEPDAFRFIGHQNGHPWPDFSRQLVRIGQVGRSLNMKSKKWLAGFAVGAMLASGGAMAAVNADHVHIALSSLRLALVKASVANTMLAGTTPSSNEQAHVAAPDKLVDEEIRAIIVSEGGVINVYLTPRAGVTGGILQLVPAIGTTKGGEKDVQFTCYSPNIPDIATAAPECTFHPPAK